MADPKTDYNYGCKIGHRRVDEAGQVTYKKTTTSELMAAIQLGIEHSIGKLLPKPKRDVLYEDFHIIESIYFPREGSNLTPAHRCRDFRFKTYAPTAFRYFRDLFGIQPDDFLLSLCNEPLQELSNPGASGSIFYVTNDDEFIIKTVQHKEAEFLRKLLPGYYMNLNQNPRTLLPKFYGLYCHQCGGKNIRFVIMNNLLPSSVVMHFKYDLKGSTYKRKASVHELTKSSPTYKDLDFLEHLGEGIFLEADTCSALLKTVEQDCRVLQSFKIMDYSMLLGIHNLDQSSRNKGIEPTTSKCVGISVQGPNRSRSLRRLAQYSTAMESIHATSNALNIDSEDVPTGGIPARNMRSERLLLYIGIIDILQSYRFAKKLEHALKSIMTDGDSISVHRPGFYAHRFQGFFGNSVFKIIPPPAQNATSNRKLLVIDTQNSTNEQKSSVLDKPFVGGEKGAVIGRPDVLPKSVRPLSPHSNQPRSPKPVLPAKPVKGKPVVLPKKTELPEASLTSDEMMTASTSATKDLKQNGFANECRERIYTKHVKPPRNTGVLANAGGGSSSLLVGTACSASRNTSEGSFLPSNSSGRPSECVRT